MADQQYLDLGVLPPKTTALFMCDLQKGVCERVYCVIQNAKKLVITFMSWT